METTKEFVEKLGELLTMAKPHLVKCELIEDDCDKYVVVTCETGYQYKIDVTANSAAATAAAVFHQMTFK